jgi:hypothetical protein
MRRSYESGGKIVRIGGHGSGRPVAEYQLRQSSLPPFRRSGLLRRKVSVTHAVVLIAVIALLLGGALVLRERTVKRARLQQTQQRYVERVRQGGAPPTAPGQNED